MFDDSGRAFEVCNMLNLPPCPFCLRRYRRYKKADYITFLYRVRVASLVGLFGSCRGFLCLLLEQYLLHGLGCRLHGLDAWLVHRVRYAVIALFCHSTYCTCGRQTVCRLKRADSHSGVHCCVLSVLYQPHIGRPGCVLLVTHLPKYFSCISPDSLYFCIASWMVCQGGR